MANKAPAAPDKHTNQNESNAYEPDLAEYQRPIEENITETPKRSEIAGITTALKQLGSIPNEEDERKDDEQIEESDRQSIVDKPSEKTQVNSLNQTILNSVVQDENRRQMKHSSVDEDVATTSFKHLAEISRLTTTAVDKPTSINPFTVNINNSIPIKEQMTSTSKPKTSSPWLKPSRFESDSSVSTKRSRLNMSNEIDEAWYAAVEGSIAETLHQCNAKSLETINRLEEQSRQLQAEIQKLQEENHQLRKMAKKCAMCEGNVDTLLFCSEDCQQNAKNAIE